MEIYASRFDNKDTPVASEDVKTQLMFASGYISFVDMYLTFVEKQELRYALAHFTDGGNITTVFQILRRSNMLNDSQMDTIFACLSNQVLRTQLIIRLCAQNLLNVLGG